MAKHRIAVVAGDGIGKEVMPEGLHVMDAAARKFGIDLQFDHFDFSSWDYYEKHGKMLPDIESAQTEGDKHQPGQEVLGQKPFHGVTLPVIFTLCRDSGHRESHAGPYPPILTPS